MTISTFAWLDYSDAEPPAHVRGDRPLSREGHGVAWEGVAVRAGRARLPLGNADRNPRGARAARRDCGGAYQLESFTAADVAEADIVRRFEDVGLGLADASIVVLARRHSARTVLTLDERHFRILNSFGDHPFEILPDDS